MKNNRILKAKYFPGNTNKTGYWACIVHINGSALGGPVLKYRNGKEITNADCPEEKLIDAMKRAYPLDNNFEVIRPLTFIEKWTKVINKTPLR
jgi:hypothetical protein